MLHKLSVSKSGLATLYIIEVLLLLIFAFSIISCSNSGGVTPIRVVRLDWALQSDSLPEKSELRNAAEILFSISGYGQFSDSTLRRYNRNQSIRIHDGAMDSLWSDLRPLESGLGRMKFNFSKIFPGNRFPAVYAIVSPFNQSVFTADSLLFLGLNHYLGVDYPPYGYFPDYVRARKVPERVLPDVAEAIVRADFPYVSADGYPTVLSRLLYEGAIVESVMQLTGLSEQQVLGYDDAQMAWVEKNEKRVWETMAERKMIFSTDSQLSAMLISPAPFTSVINTASPGAVGRFIGHRIISSYLDRHALSLAEILAPAFYTSGNALPESGY